MSKKKKVEETRDWEKIAHAIARDLVEMSMSVRKVLDKASIKIDMLEEARLLDHMAREAINIYTARIPNVEEEK